MTTYYTIKYCELWQDVKQTRKVCDLPVETVLTGMEELYGEYMLVSYQASKEFIGFVKRSNIEPLKFEFETNVVSIPYQTKSAQDAAQYMIWKGNLQFNLCGELCMCYIFGLDLGVFLETWQAKALSWYKRVFGTGIARGTNVEDLIHMADIYPCEKISLSSLSGVMTAEKLMFQRAGGWYPIFSCKIETLKGRLRSKGVLHWVVVKDAEAWGLNQGWVKIYNPFSNNIEKYSWNEFSSSIGTPYGLTVLPLEI